MFLFDTLVAIGKHTHVWVLIMHELVGKVLHLWQTVSPIGYFEQPAQIMIRVYFVILKL